MDAPVIEFNSKSAAFAEFSNFYPAPFVLDGQDWGTVEAYFQAQKFPGDEALRARICDAPTAAAAKRLGRTRSAHFRADWDGAREGVMLAALTAKFEQNPPLAALLKSTGDATLKERSPWDAYWGTGKTGKGRNRMGALLMEVRRRLATAGGSAPPGAAAV
jgi:ribA/ribD-fused uncharacterized protein